MVIAGGAGIIIIILGLIFAGIIPGLKKPNVEESIYKGDVNLIGIDDSSLFVDVLNAYRAKRPAVRVTYTQVNEENYENTVIDSLAAGEGPDVFMIHRGWLYKHKNKIAPADEQIFSVGAFKSLFPQVAEKDFVSENKVYAAPLYIDTLALFYNKNILDSKGVPVVPSTWQEFEDVLPNIRIMGGSNLIMQPAAAIGGSSRSMTRSYDLMTLLMFQHGSQIETDQETISFGDEGNAGLDYYLQFSNPNSSLYTWNDSMSDSIDEFANENLPIIFEDRRIEPVLKNKNPLLNYGVAPMLQIDSQKPVNVADYWGLSVSSQTKNPQLAWDLISFITTDKEAAGIYAKAAGRTPALRELLNESVGKTDEDGLFARQVLTARSWQEPDVAAAHEIFDNMIQSILSNKVESGDAFNEARYRLEKLL